MIRRFFRALWNLLKTPWVLALLFTLLLILLVWLVGPLVAVAGHVLLESVIARLVATIVLIFCWGLFVALFSARQKKKALADPEKAAAQESRVVDRSRLREELDYIKDKLKSAISIVTKSNFYGPRSRSRYLLPWYLVLGKEDCGKTSLLLNSGLKFPLNEQADRYLYSLKATERIEVLYGNQAVFVDTPGKYLTSQPDTPPHGIWSAFLRRLFHVRPARPLNGIIVCMSMRDIIDSDQARREHLARSIRYRLDEALKSLRNYAPVYLIFTKSDAVPGFAQFFAHLSRADREQIFGCLAKDNSLEPGSVRLELKDLMQTLNAQIIPKIHQERDLPSRGDMFRFPQELAALGPRIEDFIAEAFGPSRYHKPVLFRGFFFSSALTPKDLMAAVAREGEQSYQQGFHAASGDYAKGFFLLRLLEQCIIPEARLASADKEHVWGLRLRRYGPQVAAVGLFLLAGVFLGLSFMNNYSRLETLGSLYSSYDAKKQKTPEIREAKTALPELGELASSIRVYDPDADSSVSYGLGLYQGKTFERVTRAAYLGTLNTRFMPAVRDAAAQKVESSMDNNGELKNALRAYLMLCQPQNLNKKFIDGWLGKMWSERYLAQAETQNSLHGHMDYLITNGIAPVEPDAALVERARRALLKVPLAELAYQRMREEAEESGKAPFTFRAAIGDSPFTGDTTPIPALYTRDGYEEYLIKRCPGIIRGLTDESWVFGPNPLALSALDVSKVHKEVRMLYFRDYTKYWSGAVQTLGVRTPGTMADAGKLAEQMTAGTPPAVLVLREIRANTNFLVAEPESAVEGALKDQVAKKAQQQLGRATGGKVAKAVVGQAGQGLEDIRKQEQEEAQHEASAVRQYFLPLESLLDAAGNANPELKAVNDNTIRAGDYFSRLDSSDNKEQRVLSALLDIADEKDDTLRRLEGAFQKLPNPVRIWYSTISAGGLHDMLTIGARSINRAYQERVLGVYNKSLRGYYPFNSASGRDVSLEDFTEFFRSGGVLDNFYDGYLRSFVSRNGSLKGIMGRTLPVSGPAVAQLQRATRVQEAFFVSGRELGINFLLEPFALDASLKQVALKNADKVVTYWHGPVQGASFTWPGGGGSSSLELSDLNGINQKSEARGDWSLFRLFQRGTIKRQDGNTCLMELQLNGKWAQFLIQFRNKANPFDPSVCSFTLPESL